MQLCQYFSPKSNELFQVRDLPLFVQRVAPRRTRILPSRCCSIRSQTFVGKYLMFRDRAPEGFRISVLNFKWISTAGTHIHTSRLSIAPAVRCRCKDTEFRPERDVFLPSTRRASQRMRQQQLEVVEIYCWHRLPPQACERACVCVLEERIRQFP